MSKEKCTEDFIANAVKLMNSGAQGKDIALALGVRASTLSTWLNHPKTDNQKKLSEAMKKAEVNRTTAMIDLSPLLVAALSLELPHTPLCDDECKGLCAGCGANLNIEECTCEKTEEEEDDFHPNPFSVLRNIKFEE